MAKALKTTTAPTGQIAPFGLRMLPELREKIESAARDSGRSMNAEIVARLERSFAGSEIGFKGDPLDQLARMSFFLSMIVNDKLDGKTKDEIATLAKQAADRLNDKLVLATDGINHVELADSITKITKAPEGRKRKE
jgi:hypothetical protein